jgi:hypothetical protein
MMPTLTNLCGWLCPPRHQEEQTGISSMKSTTLVSRFALIVTVIIMAPAALAQQAGQIDDFENGTTQGWTEGGSPNEPTNRASGGPEGANDNYLRNVSSGSSGAGGKMIMFNRSQWTGDYIAAEIVSIRMWLINEGNTAMQIRIAINSGNTWFASTNGFALPAGGDWSQATFELNGNALTRVAGSASRATVLGDVEELRILSANAPNFRGSQISATLGVDDIEAVGAPQPPPPPPPPPKKFLDLVSLADANGNNTTDFGVLRFDPNIARNQLAVFDGGNGNEITTVGFGSEEYQASATVPDGTGDMIREFSVLVRGSLFARVRDVVSNTLLGRLKFNTNYNPVAFFSVGDAGGAAGPDMAMVGRLPGTGRVLAWVREAQGGALVNQMTFSKSFVPFAAVAVDNVGDSPAKEIAVLGINAAGKVQATVKDAMTGNLVGKVVFSKAFAPLFFAAVPDANGDLTHLAVLGRKANGIIQAQIKRVSDGALVANVRFSKNYDPKAFISFADSNGTGSGELGVVGINATGTVRSEVKEIADSATVSIIKYNRNFPAIGAIAVNGAAGTSRNEIAVLGENIDREQLLLVKDLLTGDLVTSIPLP